MLTFGQIVAGLPRLTPLMRRSMYVGAAIVQSRGQWTRVGPTWITEYGWLTIGPGAANWGTTQGLAELAMSAVPKTTWHAIGVSGPTSPNIAFHVLPLALAAPNMQIVRALTEEADQWMMEEES
jgi:hypothetical protein